MRWWVLWEERERTHSRDVVGSLVDNLSRRPFVSARPKREPGAASLPRSRQLEWANRKSSQLRLSLRSWFCALMMAAIGPTAKNTIVSFLHTSLKTTGAY